MLSIRLTRSHGLLSLPYGKWCERVSQTEPESPLSQTTKPSFTLRDG